MNSYIAIIDDEEDIVELVSIHLKQNGYAVKGFTEVKAFSRFIKNNTPDLVILDIMLPGTDGFEICKQLKRDPAFAAIPVIMLTAKSNEMDKVLGLELGADDYVTKPFSPRELVARVKTVLRRGIPFRPGAAPASSGRMRIDPDKYRVTVDGKNIDLTVTEFKILELLFSKRGTVFSRERLLDLVWGEDKIVLDRTIDVHIRNLRSKLGTRGRSIKNIRGVGYTIEE